MKTPQVGDIVRGTDLNSGAVVRGILMRKEFPWILDSKLQTHSILIAYPSNAEEKREWTQKLMDTKAERFSGQ